MSSIVEQNLLRKFYHQQQQNNSTNNCTINDLNRQLLLQLQLQHIEQSENLNNISDHSFNNEQQQQQNNTCDIKLLLTDNLDKLIKQFDYLLYTNNISSNNFLNQNDNQTIINNDFQLFNNNDFINDTSLSSSNYYQQQQQQLQQRSDQFFIEYPHDMLHPSLNPSFIPIIITHTITFLIGVIGNGVVITTWSMHGKFRSPTAIFLVSLAIADLLLLLVFVPLETLEYFMITWTGLSSICKMISYVEAISAMSTVLNLLAVSIERFLVIVYPIKARSWCTMSSTRKGLCIIWSFAFILSTPVLLTRHTSQITYYNTTTSLTLYYCFDIENELTFIVAIYQLLVMFILPAIFLVLCYYIVIRQLWSSTQYVNKMTQSSDNNSNDNNLSIITSDNLNNNQYDNIENNFRKRSFFSFIDKHNQQKNYKMKKKFKNKNKNKFHSFNKNEKNFSLSTTITDLQQISSPTTTMKKQQNFETIELPQQQLEQEIKLEKQQEEEQENKQEDDIEKQKQPNSCCCNNNKDDDYLITSFIIDQQQTATTTKQQNHLNNDDDVDIEINDDDVKNNLSNNINKNNNNDDHDNDNQLNDSILIMENDDDDDELKNKNKDEIKNNDTIPQHHHHHHEHYHQHQQQRQNSNNNNKINHRQSSLFSSTSTTLYTYNNNNNNNNNHHRSNYCTRTLSSNVMEITKSRIQVIKMLVLIIILFLLCWGPRLIMNVLVKSGLNTYSSWIYNLRVMCNLLSFIHSALNPFVYGFFSANFRRLILTSFGKNRNKNKNKNKRYG